MEVDSARAEAATELEPQPRQQLPFSNFGFLPPDLQARIITVSCWPSTASPSSREADCPVSRLDICTAKSLALVCKAFHPIAVKALYEHVRVGRPSTLRMLVDSIIARPYLGRLIKSLHIGPSDPLPDDWWPIIDRETLCIHLNALPEDRSASWWSSGPHHHPISIERPLDVNCLSRARRALEAAVDEASGSLDVDLRRFSYNRTGSIMNTVSRRETCQSFLAARD